MTLTQTDLIESLLKDEQYMKHAVGEMLPDDTLDLLNGTRKRKGSMGELEHLVGHSNKIAIVKADNMRVKTVTNMKRQQL